MAGGSSGSQAQNPSAQSSSPSQILNQMGYGVNLPSNGSAGGTGSPNQPQWMKGMQLGTQLAQMGMQASQAGRPQMSGAPMARPMMAGGGAPAQGLMGGAVPSGAVPGAAGMAPPMASGAQGMQQPGAGMTPQMAQALMRARSM